MLSRIDNKKNHDNEYEKQYQDGTDLSHIIGFE